ncbi:P-type conjugative transfer protein TrbG [Novosphingobium pokkalii]|uniref:P-type conjugative transfer protein TrbG n=1 Tax=Novosphingobium pokkalii TaxID=1770194 RepID=A0ABV7UZM2_9SPHN|nr:P-type conjugative transfer protein TrbG [Novosphingobium pokkalii]GHC96878.1 P-type conjugative transfer protein TrbG [Novosphingobium pokkalii]
MTKLPFGLWPLTAAALLGSSILTTGGLAQAVPSPAAGKVPQAQARPGIRTAKPAPTSRERSSLRARGARKTDLSDPQRQVGAANAAARIQPSKGGYFNAIQQYAYADGALYQVYSAPGQITDIALQEGEELVGLGPVAAGDTARWIIGDTVSGAGAAKRVHILVKPTRGDIATNLIINTDRRTYHLELKATPSTYMASVSWTYPQDALIALRRADAERARTAPAATGLQLDGLNFRYRITGDRPDWRPLRVFDDGRQVMIEFPEAVSTTAMPPLFVIGDDGAAELVNYRVSGRYMVVDRLFGAAELRIASRRAEQRVRIERDKAKPRRAS